MKWTVIAILGAGAAVVACVWLFRRGYRADPREAAIARLVERARRYNHAFQDERALAAIEEAVRLDPEDPELVGLHADFLWNVHVDDDPRMIAFYDDCIARGIGSQARWHLQKAQVIHGVATEWVGDPPVIRVIDPGGCDAALAELERAFELDPSLAQTAVDEDWLLVDWEEAFAGLAGREEYRALFRR